MLERFIKEKGGIKMDKYIPKRDDAYKLLTVYIKDVYNGV